MKFLRKISITLSCSFKLSTDSFNWSCSFRNVILSNLLCLLSGPWSSACTPGYIDSEDSGEFVRAAGCTTAGCNFPNLISPGKTTSFSPKLQIGRLKCPAVIVNIPESAIKLLEFKNLLFSLLAKYPRPPDIFDFTFTNPKELRLIRPLSAVSVEKALSEIFKCSMFSISCCLAALSASMTAEKRLSLEFLIRGIFLSNSLVSEFPIPSTTVPSLNFNLALYCLRNASPKFKGWDKFLTTTGLISNDSLIFSNFIKNGLALPNTMTC